VSAWLVNSDGVFQKSSDLTLSQLPDGYTKDSPNVGTLLDVLRFKPDAVDCLPEEYKTKLDLIKDYSLEDLQRLILEDKKRHSEKDAKKIEGWIPEHKPQGVPINVTEASLKAIVSDNLKGQAEDLKEPAKWEEEQSEGLIETVEKSTDLLDQHDKKEIGDWGEEYVLYALRAKYKENNLIFETDFGFKAVSNSDSVEVVWLNKHRNVGKGYDFAIKINGAEVEYIEVKTKLEEAEELIEITGTQWEFARKLYEEKEGDKYSLYVVSNAGKSNAHISILKNPIGLWKEGKLYAHPINFKL
jgi:hypothetical protein